MVMASSGERLFRRWFPHYRPRWEVYDDRLCSFLAPNVVWLDVGCGNNALVRLFHARAGVAAGVDRITIANAEGARFVQADLRRLPFRSQCADLVTLRMVVEHLQNPQRDLAEIARILKPGCRLMVLTTNAWSPVVFVPRLLPFRVKRWLLARLFGAVETEIFPTFHRFNTPRRMRASNDPLRLVALEMLEQTAFSPPLLAIVCGVWYGLTRLQLLKNLRSNLLAVFQKQASPTELLHDR